jgi:hypothetical protein
MRALCLVSLCLPRQGISALMPLTGVRSSPCPELRSPGGSIIFLFPPGPRGPTYGFRLPCPSGGEASSIPFRPLTSSGKWRGSSRTASRGTLQPITPAEHLHDRKPFPPHGGDGMHLRHGLDSESTEVDSTTDCSTSHNTHCGFLREGVLPTVGNDTTSQFDPYPLWIAISYHYETRLQPSPSRGRDSTVTARRT